ncbi:hypothetical protein UT300012_23790 [Paraclostridium bifermentans]
MTTTREELKSLYDRARGKINKELVDLEIAKKNNKILQTLEDDLEECEKVKNNLEQFVTMLTAFDSMTTKEDLAYKERRLDYLCSYMDKNLEVIFPYDNFRTKVSTSNKYGNERAELLLYNGGSNTPRVPAYCEGKMLRQLISFSGAIGLAECLGSHSFYMDEAFSAASPLNLSKVGKLLQDILNKGFQVIIIEQTNEIYKDIPRREIILERDPIGNCVKVVSITDY